MSRPDEQGRRMPNRQENALMLDLMLVRNTLARNSEAARERLKASPHGWRDLRLLWYLVNKVQEELLSTVPDKRIAYYNQMARHGQVIIDIPGPIPRGRHILITDDHLAAITEAAMRGECALCLKEGKEAQRCPIRQALMEVAPPAEISSGGKAWWAGCEYQKAGSALVRGEKVTL